MVLWLTHRMHFITLPWAWVVCDQRQRAVHVTQAGAYTECCQEVCGNTVVSESGTGVCWSLWLMQTFHIAYCSTRSCCLTFMLCCAAGQLETPEDEVMCVMDVLEEVGDDVARRCYWDFGDWSDLWRETKHVPNGISLQVCSCSSAGCQLCCGTVACRPKPCGHAVC